MGKTEIHLHLAAGAVMHMTAPDGARVLAAPADTPRTFGTGTPTYEELAQIIVGLECAFEDLLPGHQGEAMVSRIIAAHAFETASLDHVPREDWPLLEAALLGATETLSIVRDYKRERAERRKDLPPLYSQFKVALALALGGMDDGLDPIVAELIRILNARKRGEDGNTPVPAAELDPAPDAPSVTTVGARKGLGGYTMPNVTTRVSVAGTTAAQAIMDHFVHGDTFDVDTASDWLEAKGYARGTRGAVVSWLKLNGYISKVRRGVYRFDRSVDPAAVPLHWGRSADLGATQRPMATA